jgi:cysteine desulfurase
VIYLDHNATTPVAPEVIEVMLTALREGWGNPGSDHVYGRRARALVDQARAEVALLLGAQPDEIVFVSGGTEADDLGILGVAQRLQPGTVVTSTIEHPAVQAVCEELGQRGWKVLALGVDEQGRVRVPEALPEDTRLLTVMLAHNETGVLQPVRELAALARARGALVHTDAAQAAGKIGIDVGELGVDLLALAGHKLYAPKGIGALYVRRGTALGPRLKGGGQQGGLRSGTEPVPGIAALGEAARLARVSLPSEEPRQQALRDELVARLRAAVPGLAVSGEGTARLPNTAHVRFPGVRGADLLAACPGLAASTGSTCHAGLDEPAAVLVAMGVSHEDALGAVRLSIGRSTTEEEVQQAAEELGRAWRRR